MALKERLREAGLWPEERQTYPLAFDDWANSFSYQGLSYPYLQQTAPGGSEEKISSDFAGLVKGAYQSNGVVFACELARFLVFSEARFQFRQLRSGRPGDLFGTAALSVLEKPWEGATTGDLLSRMLLDADFAGNAFHHRSGSSLKRMRPDWVTIVIGSMSDPDVGAWDLESDVIGYIYQPGGPGSGRDPVALDRSEVSHFAPVPDPLASYRGMSWITPVVREVMGDNATSSHKTRFFENGATPNMVVTLDANITEEKFKQWIKLFEAKHTGAANAYKTLFLAGGADAKVVGTDLRQLDFKATQGAGETRIAAAAGVPPVLVGLSEGLAAATYSNYGMARRRYADMTMRPLWRNAAGSLANVIDVPSGAELWYDERDVAFLREDLKDVAEIQSLEAQTIKALIDAGFEPKSVVDAVKAGDYARLSHTGLYSVQLQPPMPEGPPPAPELDAEALGAAALASQNGTP